MVDMQNYVIAREHLKASNLLDVIFAQLESDIL